MDTGSVKRSRALSRRKFLANTTALGAASFLSLPRTAAAEPPPEVTTIKFNAVPISCIAPQYLAESLLKAEGFTDIRFLEIDTTDPGPYVGPGKADFDLDAVAPILTYIDAEAPVVTLAGLHLGCYELFGSDRVRSIHDLKGKTVPIDALGGSKHVLLSSMAAYVGLDPRTDINWVVLPLEEGMKRFADGKADAFLGFPPEPQELRARKIGHVIVNTATDKPWSQYYCCMVITHREFVRKYPVATKRVVRAILKAADLCAQALSARRGHWSKRASCRTTITPSRRSRRYGTTHGAPTIRRTPCVSMPCACMRWE